MYPGYTQLEWYEKIYPQLSPDDKPLECIQKAGEILYLVKNFFFVVEKTEFSKSINVCIVTQTQRNPKWLVFATTIEPGQTALMCSWPGSILLADHSKN